MSRPMQRMNPRLPSRVDRANVRRQAPGFDPMIFETTFGASHWEVETTWVSGVLNCRRSGSVSSLALQQANTRRALRQDRRNGRISALLVRDAIGEQVWPFLGRTRTYRRADKDRVALRCKPNLYIVERP